MSELKAIQILINGQKIDFYFKDEADKVLAHQKYKRCLAMARWCDTKGDWYYSLGESFRNRVDFYIKWREKWIKIAEKFKEEN